MSVSYGGYYGGDPRKFFPDHECCSPYELAAHKAACDAWDRGDQIDVRTRPCSPELGCERPLGVGVTVHDDETEDLDDSEPDRELGELEDEELYGLYLSNTGKDSEEAVHILAERHGAELVYMDEEL